MYVNLTAPCLSVAVENCGGRGWGTLSRYKTSRMRRFNGIFSYVVLSLAFGYD